ncbi:MAG: type II toxin-antitoxin system PemK/MazF family toxin [Candidatus Nanopelagicales bacterium]
MPEDLRQGDVVWVDFDPVIGSEQAGRRPALVVSSDAYNTAIPNVVIVLPVTRRDRGLPHHVLLCGASVGLPAASYAMTEQPRTVDRRRMRAVAGHTDSSSLSQALRWLADFLGGFDDPGSSRRSP